MSFQNDLKMRTYIYYLVLLFIIVSCQQKEKETVFKVMSWNILHGGNDIENGPQNVINIIKEVNPDILLMIETYGSGKMIADSLGFNFHLIAPKGTALDDKSTNLSMYSKFPFDKRIDTDYPFYLGGRKVIINNQSINVFANWFHYLPWDGEPEKLGKNVDELLEWEKQGTRYEMQQKVLPVIRKYVEQTDSIPMIFAGDLNSFSHLDWTENTKELHNNLVVPWFATKVLDDLGLIDTYRTLNPDVVKKPGITWGTEGQPGAHRIDYIFYKGDKIKSLESESYMAGFNQPFMFKEKKFTYPSDHGFVVTTFKLNNL